MGKCLAGRSVFMLMLLPLIGSGCAAPASKSAPDSGQLAEVWGWDSYSNDGNGGPLDSRISLDYQAEVLDLSTLHDATDGGDEMDPFDVAADDSTVPQEVVSTTTMEQFDAILAQEDLALLESFLDGYDGPLWVEDRCLIVTKYDSGTEVHVRGSINGWELGDTLEEIPFAPGVYYRFFDSSGWEPVETYKLFAQESWFRDPLNRYFRFSDVALDSAIHAQGTSRLALVEGVWSPQLNNERNLYVYVPAAAFGEPQRRFPVLFMQDGFNIFSNPMAPFGNWGVESTADELIAGGEIEPLIVVGIDTNDRMNEYLYTDLSIEREGETIQIDPHLDAYLEFVVDTVLPLVSSQFPTLAGAKATGIAGSSLGGISSFYMAWKRPDVFGKVAALSSSFWVGESGSGTEDYPSMREVIDSAPPTAPQLALKIYLDSGDGGWVATAESSASGDGYPSDARAYTDWTRNKLIALGFDNRGEWDTDDDLASPPDDLPLTTDPGDIPTLFWTSQPSSDYTGWDDYLGAGSNLLHLVGQGHIHNEAAWKARFPCALRFLWGQ